jgi:hypothetical protein
MAGIDRLWRGALIILWATAYASPAGTMQDQSRSASTIGWRSFMIVSGR